MQKTQRLRPFVDAEPNRSAMPILVGSSFAVLAVGYALLVLQPDLVRQMAASLRTLVPGGPHWAVPAMASGIAIGGAAVAVFVLSRFARGVQRSPYVWFAPVLVGFSTVVMGRLPITLPFDHVPGELFALLTAFMWLGGGALMQLPGLPPRVAGAILFTLPAVGLVAAHAQHAGGLSAAVANLDAGNQFFMFVFWLTWLGVGMLSVVTRDTGLLGSGDRRLLAQAVDKARHREHQLAAAEQRASLAEEEVRVLRASQNPLAGFADDGALEAMKPSGPGLGLKIGIAVSALAALGAAGYYTAYVPLQQHSSEQLAAAERAVAAQQTAVAAIKDELEAERVRLKEELAAAQAKTTEAETALAAAQARMAELEGGGAPSEADAAKAEAEAKAKAEADAKARAKAEARASRQAKQAAAQRRTNAAKQRAARAEQRAKQAERQQAAREARRDERALGGTVSDDPIAGLDGF